jgi:hypothetical protein
MQYDPTLHAGDCRGSPTHLEQNRIRVDYSLEYSLVRLADSTQSSVFHFAPTPQILIYEGNGVDVGSVSADIAFKVSSRITSRS